MLKPAVRWQCFLGADEVSAYEATLLNQRAQRHR